MRKLSYAISGGSLLASITLGLIVSEAFGLATLFLMVPVAPLGYLSNWFLGGNCFSLEIFSASLSCPIGSAAYDRVLFVIIAIFYFFVGALLGLIVQKRVKAPTTVAGNFSLGLFAVLVTVLFLGISTYELTEDYRAERSRLNSPNTACIGDCGQKWEGKTYEAKQNSRISLPSEWYSFTNIISKEQIARASSAHNLCPPSASTK